MRWIEFLKKEELVTYKDFQTSIIIHAISKKIGYITIHC